MTEAEIISGFLGTVGFPLVGGSILGFVTGYAIKKIMKIAAIVAGIFFAGLMFMQWKGFLQINWTGIIDSIQGSINYLLNTNTVQSSIQGIYVNLGIPLSSGFGIGLFM